MANLYKTKKQEKNLASKLDSDISLKNGSKLKKGTAVLAGASAGYGSDVWLGKLMDVTDALVHTSDGEFAYGGSFIIDTFPNPTIEITDTIAREPVYLEGADKYAAQLAEAIRDTAIGDVEWLRYAIDGAVGVGVGLGLIALINSASYLKNLAMNGIAKGLAKYQLRKTPKYPSKAQIQSEAYERILDLIPDTPELPSGLEQELDA